MKKFLLTIAGAAALLSGCQKPQHEDNTVYGNIQMIDACEQSLIMGKLYIDPENKLSLTEAGWKDFLDYLNDRGDNFELDFINSLGFEVNSSICRGSKVYSFGSSDYDVIILYIHGGAYCNNAFKQHFTMCNDLARKDGGIKVVLPVYPLTPQYTWKESYELLDDLYSELLKEKKPIVIMGDSAGGGLSCAFSQYLHKSGKTLPTKRILLSPWLDVTFADEQAAQVEPRDEMLGIYGLRQLGNIWKGDLDAKDYRISPLYGDLDDGIPTLITVGTNEIMLPDCTTLYNKLVAAKCPTTIIYGIGLWHVFPIFDIPESQQTRLEIIGFIRAQE